MTFITYTTALTFLLIALIHFLWGINIYWPAANETAIARAVVGARGITQMPNFWACSFVALALIIGAMIVLQLGGVIAIKVFPLWLFQLAGVGLALVFLSRGIIGFTPFWEALLPEEPFRTWNKQFYSPLCLLLSTAVAVLVVQSKLLNSSL